MGPTTKDPEQYCCPSSRRLSVKTRRKAQILLGHRVPASLFAVLRVLCVLVPGPAPLTCVTEEAEALPAGSCFWSLSPAISARLEPVNQAPDLPALQVPGICFPFWALEIAECVLLRWMCLGKAKSELTTVGYREIFAWLETFARK